MRRQSIVVDGAKSLSVLSMVLVLFALVFTLSACSDDDDDDGGGSGTSSIAATVIETTDGDKLQVTGVGDWTYEYDENGYLTYVYAAYDEGFTVSDNGTQLYGDEDELKLSLNSQGYITKMVSVESGRTWIDNMSYDSEGHLIKVDILCDVDDDPWSQTYTLTWKDGLLTKLVFCYDDDYTDTYTYSYDDESLVNTYKQYTPSMVEENSYLAFFGYIGLIGVGPTFLPSKVEFTTTDGYEEYTVNYTYGFNSNGTINYQEGDDGCGKLYFTYGTYGGTRGVSLVGEKSGC